MSTVSAVVQPTPVSAKEAPRLRLEFLDGLRGFASLYVMVYHCFLGYNSLTNQLASLPSYWMGKLIKLLYFGLFNFGHEAVVVFIVLSGYVLMLPVARTQDGHMPKGVWDYFKRRARRILPPYYAALAICFLLVAFVPHMEGLWDNKPRTLRWGRLFPISCLFTTSAALGKLSSRGPCGASRWSGKSIFGSLLFFCLSGVALVW
ncbi:MAG TPA: acyltransferase family protein [Chthonomonas sp.]|uniref:acyltransferase family protein n=1 Tax=Chthonomonas sp. TaxID=2282153 RepID=UPI002B4B4735|nr:acyltransferase family protein [Chthonomonas sp.]HLH78655.1 acyltransferase family protein [Chthonomonas sp.]